MTKKKRSKDPNQIAKFIVDLATGEKDEPKKQRKAKKRKKS